MVHCVLAPGDFNSTVNELQFSSTTTSIAMSVTLTADEKFEETEVFHAELEPEGFTGVIDPSRAKIFISDTNGMIVFLHCQSIPVYIAAIYIYYQSFSSCNSWLSSYKYISACKSKTCCTADSGAEWSQAANQCTGSVHVHSLQCTRSPIIDGHC